VKPIVVIELPEPEKITKSEVVEYLNEVIAYYGPPCEFCAHFSAICAKNHKPRRYTLEAGPYEEWHIRKFCEDFTGKGTKDENEDVERYVRNSLNCNAQKYGS